MAQPNLELAQDKMESSLNSSASLNSWPEGGQGGAGRGARMPMLLAAVALVVSLGSAGYQMMAMKQLASSINAKTKDTITKALAEERKSNNMQAQLTEAMDKLKKENDDAIALARKDLTQLHNDGIAAMQAKIDEMGKSVSRAPASTGKGKPAKKGKRR